MDIRKPRKRMLAAGVCMIVVAVILLSAIFIIKEANHDCTGPDCPICACMNAAEQTFKQLGTGVAVTVSVISLVLAALAVWNITAPILPCSTPVSRKTRMNN